MTEEVLQAFKNISIDISQNNEITSSARATILVTIDEAADKLTILSPEEKTNLHLSNLQLMTEMFQRAKMKK